nr:hypothetical protein [Methylorubrum zatmanii]
MRLILKSAALFSLVATLISAAGAEGSLSAPECEALKKVIPHTQNDFALLKDKKTSSNSWSISMTIPGTKSCYLKQRERISLDCESEPLVAAPDDSFALRSFAAPLRAQRADAIKECLGPTWTRQATFEEFFSGVNDVDAERSIIINVDRDNMFDPPYLRTSIARMNQVPLEQPPRSISDVKPTGYCNAAKEALIGAQAKFSSLIKNSERNDLGRHVLWKSDTDLPGWTQCYVHEWFKKENCRYLTCTAGPVSGDGQAEELMKVVTSDLIACLGKGWRKNAIRDTAGVRGTRFIAQGNPIIELKPSESLYAKDSRYVNFSIRSEVACK